MNPFQTLAAALLLSVAMLFFAANSAQALEPSAGVTEPDGYRMEHYRSPVPNTLKGARVVTTDGAEELWRAGSAVFIDVYPQAPKPPGLPEGTIWRSPKHESIKGAVWLANVGYGPLRSEVAGFLETELERLSENFKDRTLVFFCLRDCWMSWNAAKRAVALGYTNVVWFPDGTDGWKDFGLPTEKIGVRMVEGS